MQMFKKILPWAILGLLIIYSISAYNGLVGKDESLSNQWGKVQTAYQLRADKIKNLVSIVKSSAKFEKETLMGVVEARAGIARSATFDPKNGTPEEFKKYNNIQAELGRSINVVFERYPELRTTEQYKSLMFEYSETENMIKSERDIFNNVVKDYNLATRRFPSSIFASIFGFKHKEYFQADAGTEKAPDVGKQFEDK